MSIAPQDSAPANGELLLSRHLDGELDAGEFAQLQAWLREDAIHINLLVKRTIDHHRIAELATTSSAAGVVDLCDDETDDCQSIPDFVFQDAVAARHQHELEDQAIRTAGADSATLNSPDVLSSPSYPSSFDQNRRTDKITLRQLASVFGFILGKALTSKPAYKLYAVAALVMLAATLFFVFSGGNDTTTVPLAEQGASDDVQPNTTNPLALAVVATLTAEHDAVWDRRPGHELHAGQRLTLTQGSATITTDDGAVATLFAPCSVRLIDGNALHLTRGRLAGRVDSDRAKGFAVHLPGDEKIVDLGTAFTVAVDRTGLAEVRVTEGLVMWAPTNDHPDAVSRKPLLVAAGESAALADGRPRVTSTRLLGIDFQHTGARSRGGMQPMVGVTQTGFVAFDETRVSKGNRATYATDTGEITFALSGLDQDQHNGYFTRLPTPAADPFPGFDLYNDFVFENDDGRFTLTLAGPAITPGQAYDLTFYAYDPGDPEAPGSSYGQTQSVAFTGTEGTLGQTVPITYTIGTHPTRVEQFKTTATFTADAQGRITIEATDTYDDNEQRIRLCAIEIARRLALNNITTN